MTHVREPRIHPISIDDLRPTQITIGFREVALKRENWQQERKQKQEDFLGQHMVPVIHGPKDRFYLIDHHHLARALQEEGVRELAVTVVANLHNLDKEAFWIYLDNRRWMHPFDDRGRRRNYRSIPRRIADLVDDPFRSLAGELRRIGGFAKDTTPFSEFLWADFLRRRIERSFVEKNFSSALERGLELAKSRGADFLPGWCGPVIESSK